MRTTIHVLDSKLSPPAMIVRDGDPARGLLPDPTHMSVAFPKGWAEKQKIRRRRLQLAAALIEADNSDIDKRITFVIQNDPHATDLLAHLTKLIKHANESVIFRNSSANDQEYQRPIYTFRLSTQRELSRGYLNLQQDCELEDASQSQGEKAEQAQDMETSDAGKDNFEQISFSLDDYGSPLLNVLEQTPSIEVAAQAYAEQELQTASKPLQEPESRSKRLLERIHKLNAAVHSTPASDISFSSTENASIKDQSQEIQASDISPIHKESVTAKDESEHEYAHGTEEPMEGLGIHSDEPRPDLHHFRERVMNRKSQVGVSDTSQQRTSDTSSNLTDTETLLDQPLHYDPLKPLHGSEMTTKQLNSMARGVSHIGSPRLSELPSKTNTNVHEASVKPPFKLTSIVFSKKEKPSRLLIPAVSRRNHESNRTPILDGLSPVPDSYDPAVQTITDHLLSTEGEMMGVSLQSPSIPPGLSKLASVEEPPTSSETVKPLRTSTVSVVEPNSSYMAYEDDPTHANQSFMSDRETPVRRRHSWVPSYVCVPAFLQGLQVKTSDDTFYVPQGAFKLDHGVILPTLSSRGDSYGPIQVPLGMGRRVLYPSTALFRNVLVTRDHEQEGWGWDRYTNSAKYFEGIHADDDDSDDELPLMDVRIHRREKHITEKRISREKKRQRRARAERRRLRALAREKGKPASAYGVTEEDTEGELSDASSDYDISSDETDPDLPWVDDLRPAGKLYGKSLVGVAEARKTQRDGEIRFYGQASKDDSDRQHPFHNDTRERMRRIFGEQSMFQAEKEGQSAHDEVYAPASRLADLANILDGDVPGQNEQITPEELRAHEVMEDRDLDEHVADAWKDESPDEEATTETHVISYKPQRRTRTSHFPRWMDKNEDDVPLSELHLHSPQASDDDTIPLASQHPQAAIIAEKEAIIRRLEEENRQVRMLLQMRTSLPPMPLQPWMVPMSSMVPPPSASMEQVVLDTPNPFLQALPSTPARLAEPSVVTHDNQNGVIGWLSEREAPDM